MLDVTLSLNLPWSKKVKNTITYGDGFNSSTKLATQQQIETGEVGNRSLRKNTHPTVKPLKLIIPKIAISSNENSIVVDMFGGSGSTMMACEKLNRSCYMVEYNPKYVNEIINRWEAYTDKKAEYIGNVLSTDKIEEGDK